MNYLIIFAHPNTNSLNGSILSETKSLLEAKENSNIKEINLYADKFNPCLVFNKKLPRRDLCSRDDTKEYRDLISWADNLVFIYPIWWGRPPAILLGFIDKVIVSGFAYYTPPKAILPVGLLKSKKATIITTQNGPVLLTRMLYHDSHRVLIKRQVLNFCGIKKVKFLEIGHSESMNTQRFTKIKSKLKKLF